MYCSRRASCAGTLNHIAALRKGYRKNVCIRGYSLKRFAPILLCAGQPYSGIYAEA